MESGNSCADLDCGSASSGPFVIRSLDPSIAPTRLSSAQPPAPNRNFAAHASSALPQALIFQRRQVAEPRPSLKSIFMRAV
jgi:hypothetical protein